ncbi:FAD-binding protein [Streptomyces sp. M10(2022)]
MDQAWWCPGLEQPDGHSAFTLGLSGGLIVDASGNRFANESLPYDRMGREMAAQPAGGPAYFVFDSRSGGRAPAITVPSCPPGEHLAAGTWVQAGSLPELARRTGIPAAALTRTVSRFNASAARGTDEDFHRGEDPYDRFSPAGTPGPGPTRAWSRWANRRTTRRGWCSATSAPRAGSARTCRDGSWTPQAAHSRPVRHGQHQRVLHRACLPGPGVPIGTAMVFASLAVREMTAAGR